jgi:DNA-binding Lrp family transcriptional regulator
MTVTTEDTTAPEVLDGEVVNDTADQPGEVAGGSENAPEPAPKAKRAAKAKAGAKAPSKAVAKKEAKPVEKSELTPGDARKLTARLRTGLENSIELFVTAYSKRIWLALGHASWQEYLDAELGDLRVSFPREDRKRMVAQMVQPPSKMSTRAIASALGVDQKTVSNDLAELRAEGVISVPSTRVGVDGVEQSAEKAERTVDPEKVAAKFVERVTRVFEKLDGFVGDLTDLSNDDLWEQEAGQIAQRHRADMARLLDSLNRGQSLIPGAGE